MKKFTVCLLIIFIAVPMLLTAQKLPVVTEKTLPKTDFLIVTVNNTTNFICTADFTAKLKIPADIIVKNYLNQYRLFKGFGTTVSDVDNYYFWDIDKNIFKEVSIPKGYGKWQEYSTGLKFMLKDGTVIAEHMLSDKKNTVFIKTKKKKNHRLHQFRKYTGANDFQFQTDGSYIFVDAPGTMKSLTAPFSNQVKGYPHTIYYGKSINAKPKKVVSVPALLSLRWFNNGKSISYIRLGKYKWGEYRNLIFEVVDLKTGKTRQIGQYLDDLKKDRTKDTPIVYGFTDNPYLIFESHKYTQKPDGDAIRHFSIYNVETGKTTPLLLPDDFQMVSSLTRNRTINDQYINSPHIVVGKKDGKRMKLRVLTVPNLETVMETSISIEDYYYFNAASLFQYTVRADFVQNK